MPSLDDCPQTTPPTPPRAAGLLRNRWLLCVGITGWLQPECPAALRRNAHSGARVLLATQPIDFRKGAHSLAVLAQEVLAEDPFSGAVIVYRAKRGDRLKILVWDSSGLVLVWKYLVSH